MGGQTKVYGDSDAKGGVAFTLDPVNGKGGRVGSDFAGCVVTREVGETVGSYAYSDAQFQTAEIAKNYDITFNAPDKYTITKRTLTITVPNRERLYGSENPSDADITGALEYKNFASNDEIGIHDTVASLGGTVTIKYGVDNGSAIAKSADGDYTFDETKFETVNVTNIDKDNGYVTFKLSPDWTGYIVTRTVDKAGNYGDVRVASVKLENPPEESRPTPTPVVKNEPAPTPAPVVVNYKTGVGFGAEVIVPVIVVVALIGVGAFVIVKKKNGDSEEKAAEKPEDKTEEKKQ